MVARTLQIYVSAHVHTYLQRVGRFAHPFNPDPFLGFDLPHGEKSKEGAFR